MGSDRTALNTWTICLCSRFRKYRKKLSQQRTQRDSDVSNPSPVRTLWISQYFFKSGSPALLQLRHQTKSLKIDKRCVTEKKTQQTKHLWQLQNGLGRHRVQWREFTLSSSGKLMTTDSQKCIGFRNR